MEDVTKEHFHQPFINKTKPEIPTPISSRTTRTTASSFSSRFSHRSAPMWPSRTEANAVERSLRRRVFLIMTKPASSQVSFFFFIFMVVLIFTFIVLMSLMTVSTFTEIPSSCELCLNSTSVITADCVCEGEPLDYLTKLSNALYIIFTAEVC
jgi:hypothetical protein